MSIDFIVSALVGWMVGLLGKSLYASKDYHMLNQLPNHYVFNQLPSHLHSSFSPQPSERKSTKQSVKKLRQQISLLQNRIKEAKRLFDAARNAARANKSLDAFDNQVGII